MAGNVVSVRAGIVLLDTTAANTASLATQVSAQSVGNSVTLNFLAPDGRRHTLALASDGSVQWDIPEVSGQVTLQGSTSVVQPLTCTLTPTGATTSATITETVTAAADGTFSLTGIPAGTYTLSIKGSRSLRKDMAVDTTSGTVSGLTVPLLAGDLNGDNAVTLSDLAMLRAAYGSTPTSTNWNPNADLNGDGAVTLSDLAILRANYGKTGDP